MSTSLRPSSTALLLLLTLATGLSALAPPLVQQADPTEWDEVRNGPLPRWREGGTPAVAPGQLLHPFAIDLTQAGPDVTGPPTSGVMSSPPEYDPAAGVLFRYSSSSWPAVVTDCVTALTADPAHDDIAYVVVAGTTQTNNAISSFTAAGADMSKVEFLVHKSDSIWLRDYGPHFVWQDGALGIADSHYYPTRPRDNFIPTQIAEDDFQIPSFHMGLYYSGGNFQPGPTRSGFVTSLINQDNGDLSGAEISQLYDTYQGIDTLHILPRLPGSVDGTGHIDMWLYLVDEDTVIIGEFKPGSNQTAIDVTNNAVPYMEALGFEVHRVPAWNGGSTHFTYTNAYRVNDRIFIPTYGLGNPNYLDEDADALAVWQAAAGPSVEIVPINCWSIIPAAGAIHCIVMQVPKYTDPVPSAHLLSPDGGEILASGTEQEVHWAATDDVDVTSVELSWSDDGGMSFPYLIASGEPNDGYYSWTVPTLFAEDAVMRVRAFDGGGNFADGVSETSCEIVDLPQNVYDFSSGAGVDRWAWGNLTSSWSELEGQRHPAGVSTELSAGAYAALAVSDATGNDADSNRYISPNPGSGKRSTHILEFTLSEDPWTMRDIGIEWEGYGDNCVQMEMYVWDHEARNWGGGPGLSGENNHMSNYAGNRDDVLVGHITGNFGRYVDLDGTLTVLLYAERTAQESFLDYAAVTVTRDDSLPGPWVDLANGLAGTHGVPGLTGLGTLVGGDLIGLTLSNALESTTAALVVGLTRIDATFKGGVLVPSPDIVLMGLPTGALGTLELASSWPAGMPVGFTTYYQYWVTDAAAPHGLSASRALSGTTP